MRIIILALCILIIISSSSAMAAYVVRPLKTAAVGSGVTPPGVHDNSRHAVKWHKKISDFLSKMRRPWHVFGHQWVAITLNVLSLYPLIFLMGAARIYYGYWAEGILQFLGFLAIVAGAFLVVFGLGPVSAGAFTAAVCCFIFGGVMYLWQLTDLFRIIGNDLVPKNERRKNRYRY